MMLQLLLFIGEEGDRLPSFFKEFKELCTKYDVGVVEAISDLGENFKWFFTNKSIKSLDEEIVTSLIDLVKKEY